MDMVRRFGVYLVALDPMRGSEMQKTRPCVVISPEEMHVLRTVIIAPMTTKGKPYPTRVPVTFRGKSGLIALDQIRTVDRGRLVKHLGRIHPKTGARVLAVLDDMFAE